VVLYDSRTQICYSLIEIELVSVCCFCSALYILDHVMRLYSICPVDCDGTCCEIDIHNGTLPPVSSYN
jgi:hypothetical protein